MPRARKSRKQFVLVVELEGQQRTVEGSVCQPFFNTKQVVNLSDEWVQGMILGAQVLVASHSVLVEPTGNKVKV